jgi:Beta-propeller repeat
MKTFRIPLAALIFCFLCRASDRSPAPLRFEPNSTPTGPETTFVARAPNRTIHLGPAGVTVRAGQSDLKMNVIGGNSNAEPSPSDPQETRVNYLVGNPEEWRTGVSTYRSVAYHEIYPGIDISYSGDDGHLAYTFSVKPGAQPRRIRLRFEGLEQPESNPSDNLLLSDSHGRWASTPAEVYQLQGNIHEKISGGLVATSADEIAFQVGSYDSARPLVIHATLTFSTYLGGRGQDTATAVAADASGNIYVTGWTESLDLPAAPGSRLGLPSGNDVYVAKMGPAGNLIYLTYLGGLGDDRGFGVAVDKSGAAVVTGWTYSSNFPILNAAQSRPGGGRDAFVAKLSASGTSLIFSTFLGGQGADAGNGIAMDSAGAIYVAGETASSDFPVLSAYQSRIGGGQDAFVSKYGGNGALLYSTFLGGVTDDRATAIFADAVGDAFITGSTYSSNFPVVNAFQSVQGGGQDAFAAKLGPTGSTLIYSTYLGGRGGTLGAPETGSGIVVDSSGSAYVAGTTSSSNFPTLNPIQRSLSGMQDAFILKLSPAGSGLTYSTYLGGSSFDVATAVAVDATGRAYVAGYAASTDFPTATPLQSSNGGGYDAFLVRLSTAGNVLDTATYLGGAGSDSASGIALDAGGNVYVVGQTLSPNFPLVNAVEIFQPAPASAFVALIPMPSQPSRPAAISISPASGTGTSQTFTFVTADPDGASDLFRTIITFASVSSSTAQCIVVFIPPASVYLLNDSMTDWLSPVILGTANQSQNSQCTVNGPASSVQTVGNNRTLKLDFAFKSPMTGLLNVYLAADDLEGMTSATLYLGSWTVTPANRPPSPVSVSPSSGTGISQKFTLVTTDPNGASDLFRTTVTFAALGNPSAPCVAILLPPSSVYLINDSATAWLGPVTLGTASQLQNSQCSVNGTASSVQAVGNTRTLNLEVAFKPPMAGSLNVYLAADDLEAASSATLLLGTWTVPSADQPPSPVSVTPASGTGTSQKFTFVTTDPNGASDLFRTVITFASLANPAPCVAIFIPPSSVYLINDSTTAWLGPVTLGSANQLHNSQCTVNGTSSSVQSAGNSRTLNLEFAFAAPMAGLVNVYLAADDLEGVSSSTLRLGTWTVPATDQPPAPISVSPSSGSGTAQKFTLVTADPNGAADLFRTVVTFASLANPSAPCVAIFLPPSSVYLINDSVTAWLGPVTLGTANQLQNSQCSVNGTASSVQTVGNTRTLNLEAAFKAPMKGLMYIYLAADDLEGMSSATLPLATWTVP